MNQPRRFPVVRDEDGRASSQELQVDPRWRRVRIAAGEPKLELAFRDISQAAGYGQFSGPVPVGIMKNRCCAAVPCQITAARHGALDGERLMSKMKDGVLELCIHFTQSGEAFDRDANRGLGRQHAKTHFDPIHRFVVRVLRAHAPPPAAVALDKLMHDARLEMMARLLERIVFRAMVRRIWRRCAG